MIEKINYLYNTPMQLGSGYMATQGFVEAMKRLGILHYAFNQVGDEFLNEEELQRYPILYIRGFLPGRMPYVKAGGNQFKACLQSESYFTRHGVMDTSSSHIREREKLFDVMFTTADTDLNIYRIPTYYLPSWADITVLDDVSAPEYDELGFVGGLPGREDWFKQDKNGIVRHQQTLLDKDSLVNAQRYTELINKFSILVAPPGRFFNGMTGRAWEIMACRRLCLAYRNPDTMFIVDKYFEDGVDLVYWNTFEEMESKFNYYRAHRDEAYKIACNGYEKVRKFHNQDIRAMYMFNVIDYEYRRKLDNNIPKEEFDPLGEYAVK